MIPIVTTQLTVNRGYSARRVARSLLILPVITCVLACVSCTDQSPPIVDVTPLASAVRVFAYAVLGVGVLSVLGKLVK